ncbi:codanin-1 [Folsomia candida]|uniref:codanin-1 n=1 Tax=Folsomia candida TaxID=158441 RepID=UPI000B8FD20D|nr:codanin-1 [Folsomia candida]XP_035701157.1 codanin-1 [Folsomia candida]
MMMMTSTTDPNLEMLDIVHKLASLSKVSPEFASSSSFTPSADPVGVFKREFPNNKIVTTTSSSSSCSTSSLSQNNYSAAHISLTLRPPAMPPSSNLNGSPGRRIKPVSAPRRPPDIQNRTLFPSIDDSMHELHSAFATTMTPQQKERFPSNNKPTSSGFSSASENKLRNLEIKLQGRTLCGNADQQQQETSEQKLQLKTRVNLLTPKRESTETITKKRQCPRSAELFAEITPEIASNIDKVASEYSSLLDKNVSQNIIEEISLLLQLIVSTRPLTSTELEYTNIASKIGGDLTTVAQQIFFVIKVLTLQLSSSLVSIDPEVVQLLVDKYPHRIPKSFRKNFQAWCEIQRDKGRKEMQVELSRKPSEFHQCVTFRSETDGRSNFPSQGNFHSFCKQRDLFYLIKTLWEERKGTTTIPGGRDQSSFDKTNSFSRSRPSKIMGSSTNREIGDPLHQNIKALFSINSTWVNLSHFAALFSAQYTMDSMEESRHERSVRVQDDVMKGLEQANPDRMAKLNNRMSSISELESGSKDCFAFQQYFITTAASPPFNQHLVDRISFEIQQIEDSLDSSAEAEAISEHEEEYLLRKSVLLAKLLGWIAFLPYREAHNNSNSTVAVSQPNNSSLLDRETLSSKHVELRRHQKPSLDLYSILCNAVKKSRLTFTLPWIIEFLSSADYISLQLPAYKKVILLICSAYRNLFSVNENLSQLCLENKNFLRFWCGNLFSLDVFPIAFLHDNEDDLTDQILNSHQPDKLSMTHLNEGAGCIIPIDAKTFLGEHLSKFYFTVKFNHMKFTLHSGLQHPQVPATITPSPFGNNGQHRHIRPISARPSPRSPKTISIDAELQRQLECSFFDLNSASVKRTVDFISDRIASNYVKILRKTLSDRRNELAQERIFEENAAELCRTTMLQGVSGFINSKCQVSVNLLIGETLSMDALKICQQIAERQTTDKVSQWIEIHIKPEMFPEIPLASPHHPPPSTDAVLTPTGGEDNNNTTTAAPSFRVMITLHRCMKRLHDKFPVLDSAIDDILNCTPMGNIQGMISTLVDFGVTLIAFWPQILNAERQMKLICLWKPCWSLDCQLLSPRNILILSECSENVRTLSWTKLEEIILLLIKESLLDFETVEQDCFRLLREGLSPQESKKVSQLLKRLISLTKGDHRNYADGSSREVVEWISWFCSDDHYDGEF